MPLVYCGACSHAPGITARAERADTQSRQALETALHRMGDDIRATRPDALIVVAAEHFANFFMNNMPAFAMGMAIPTRARSRTRPSCASSGRRCRATRRCPES